MLAGVAGEILKLQGEVNQLAHRIVGFVLSLEIGNDALRFPGRFLAAPERIVETQVQRPHGNQLGDLVDLSVGHAEHAPGIAQHGLGRHGAEGDDLADVIAPVLGGDVLDHLIALVHAEVDVEIGHRHAFRIEEPLEQQAIAQGIDVGDAQRPGHHRARARAASGTYRDVVVLGPVDEVGNDQEVAGEAHLHDHVDFDFKTLAVVLGAEAGGGCLPGQARGEAAACLLADPRCQIEPFRHREIRQVVRAELELQGAALGQLDGVLDGLRQVRKQLRHLRW